MLILDTKRSESIFNVQKLYRVQNSTARNVTDTERTKHRTRIILVQLHSLEIAE